MNIAVWSGEQEGEEQGGTRRRRRRWRRRGAGIRALFLANENRLDWL